MVHISIEKSDNLDNSALLEVSKIGKSYALGETTVVALDDINCKITAGGIVALMGPSGSGKSTLLNLIGALDKPTDGTVKINGQDLSDLSRDDQASFRNATIGFVFQNFNLIPVLTTLENVILPAQLGRRAEDDGRHVRARDLLERVGLGKQINQSVNRLSGGQMQRVAIARALINKPPIILADEPTANLDHKTADTMLQILKELCESEGSTVIIATHDHAVLPFCQRVITLRDGKLTSDELK